MVLLITSRGRWMIPKGWPEKGLRDRDLAAKEAIEEAGVEGEVGAKPVGKFGYIKQLDFFEWATCAVEVYTLRCVFTAPNGARKERERCAGPRRTMRPRSSRTPSFLRSYSFCSANSAPFEATGTYKRIHERL